MAAVPDRDIRVLEQMQRYGGSFVKALAECLWHADAINYQKLKAIFPEYFNQYRLMANKD